MFFSQRKEIFTIYNAFHMKDNVQIPFLVFQAFVLQCPRLLNFFWSQILSSPPSTLSWPPSSQLPTFPNSAIACIFVPKSSSWTESSWDSSRLWYLFLLFHMNKGMTLSVLINQDWTPSIWVFSTLHFSLSLTLWSPL